MSRLSALMFVGLFFAGVALPLERRALAEIWPTSVERTTAELQSSDVQVRRDAVQRLTSLPASTIEQVLPALLKDPDAEVRAEAGRAAIHVGFDASTEAEVWLADPEPSVREIAARMLGGRTVTSSAVTALARTLSDPVAAVRLEAAKALAHAPADEGARVLLGHLDDTQEAFVLAVVDSLTILGNSSAIMPLVGKVQDPRVAVRRAVVRALGELDGRDQVTMPLILAMSDTDPEVRRLAVESAVAVRAVDAIPALEDRLQRDRDIDVQAAAVSALLGLVQWVTDDRVKSRVVGQIVGVLSHDRQELRSEALAALTRSATLARTELRDCLNGRTEEATAACAVALAHDADPENVALLVAAWRQGRLAAAELLTSLAPVRGDQALLVVLELLNAPARSVRQHAMAMAGQLLDARGGDGRAVEPIAEVLRRAKTADDIESLVELLGRTASTRAVPFILPYLKSSTPLTSRTAAVRALGHVPNAKVPSDLVTALLVDEEVELRAAVVMALREGAWTTGSAPLLRLLAAAKFDEEESLALALWGPARHIRDPQHIRQLESLIDERNDRVRAALIEALARLPWRLTKHVWARQVRSKSCVHRAKVAEVLGQYPESQPLLIELARDGCVPAVTNAVWALGYHGDRSALPVVTTLVSHSKREVAGNALATLGKLAKRLQAGGELSGVFCDQVRAAVRGGNAARGVNALFALRQLGLRCDGGDAERTLLALAKTPEVRLQAARLLATVPAPEPDLDAKALKICTRSDVDGEVAAACMQSPASSKASVSAPTDAVVHAFRPATVMVVPAVRTSPEPHLPFTLEMENGEYRFGWADSRGAVWVQTRDSGELELRQPLGLW